MGYGKRRFTKRRIIDVRPKQGTVSKIASTAYRWAKKAVSVINAECKKSDFTFASSSTNNGNVGHLTNIDIGNTAVTRNGNVIRVKGIYFRWNALISSSASQTTLRCIIFRDNNTTGTQPSPDDFLGTIGTTTAPLQEKDLTSGIRFKTIATFMIPLSSFNSLRTGKKYIKLNHHVYYAGSLGTDESKNQLYIMTISNESTNAPTFTAVGRVYFYDN